MSRDLNDADPILATAFALLKEGYQKYFSTYELIVTETHRTIERQKELYAQGRTKPGQIVTRIDGEKLKGKHNYYPSRAIDIGVRSLDTGKLVWDDVYFKPIGLMLPDINKTLKSKVSWGGAWKTFKDYPHLEI